MKGTQFVADMRKKFPGDTVDAIADRLGLSRPTLRKWASSDQELAAYQLTNALLKARDRAIADAQLQTIKPIVEFYPMYARIPRSVRAKKFCRTRSHAESNTWAFAENWRQAMASTFSMIREGKHFTPAKPGSSHFGKKLTMRSIVPVTKCSQLCWSLILLGSKYLSLHMSIRDSQRIFP